MDANLIDPTLLFHIILSLSVVAVVTLIIDLLKYNQVWANSLIFLAPLCHLSSALQQ